MRQSRFDQPLHLTLPCLPVTPNIPITAPAGALSCAVPFWADTLIQSQDLSRRQAESLAITILKIIHNPECVFEIVYPPPSRGCGTGRPSVKAGARQQSEIVERLDLIGHCRHFSPDAVRLRAITLHPEFMLGSRHAILGKWQSKAPAYLLIAVRNGDLDLFREVAKFAK